MTCPCCKAARETAGGWPYFELQCAWCGARLIQRIGKLPGRLTSELSQRRKAVLADWVRWGHAEQEIRALVAGPMAVEPVKKGNK